MEKCHQQQLSLTALTMTKCIPKNKLMNNLCLLLYHISTGEQTFILLSFTFLFLIQVFIIVLVREVAIQFNFLFVYRI